jgi:hypothetical protein
MEAVVAELDAVVLPTASNVAVCSGTVAPLITIVEALNPTDTPPAPENVKAFNEALVVDVSAVVLPEALKIAV